MANIKCPFYEQFNQLISFDCPYLEEDDMCKGVEINAGNSDAWCSTMIFEGVTENTAYKNMCLNFNWILEKVDEMHRILCKGKVGGPWQERVEQLLKGVKEEVQD